MIADETIEKICIERYPTMWSKLSEGYRSSYREKVKNELTGGTDIFWLAYPSWIVLAAEDIAVNSDMLAREAIKIIFDRYQEFLDEE